jgi:hypothetical protein
MWEPRRLITLWAFTACYRDSFSFYLYSGKVIRLTSFNLQYFSSARLLTRGMTCPGSRTGPRLSSGIEVNRLSSSGNYYILFSGNQKGHTGDHTECTEVSDVRKVLPSHIMIHPQRHFSQTVSRIDSKRSWRWCITLRITGFLDFVHRPIF